MVCHDRPYVLPPDRGVSHETDLVPGTKYCAIRKWLLPKEQCDAIDDFFCAKHEAGRLVRVNLHIQHRHFCVKKPNGKWRIVHAYNKLNAATIPAQTPIPQKYVFKTTWLVVLRIVHSMDIINCSCEWVIFRLQQWSPRVVCYGMAGDAPRDV